MHKVAEKEDRLRTIICNQRSKAALDFLHSPRWKKRASRTLAEFIAVMQIRDCQPVFRFVNDREARIKAEIFGYDDAAGHVPDPSCKTHASSSEMAVDRFFQSSFS